MPRISSLLILLACCQCAAPPNDSPHTAEALVQNTIAIYNRDDLLRDDFYSDNNLKRVSGATTVDRSPLKKMADDVWREDIDMQDFAGMEAPVKSWGNPIRVEMRREVKMGKTVSANFHLIFQADYAGTRRSLTAPLLGSSCTKDAKAESEVFMAITRESFNPSLGSKRPVIVSCTGSRKQMVLDFGVSESGDDPTLGSITISEIGK